MNDKSTKERILDTAERLFADRGFDATSLRAITTEADVNLAAVNYHFGSKDELIEAVFARRAAPMNAERLEMLERCQRDSGQDPPELECILRALLWPALRMARDPKRGGPVMLRLIGRFHAETDERIDSLLSRQFGPVGRCFMEALQKAVPTVNPTDLPWRFLFTIGSMAFTMTDQKKLEMISEGRSKSSDVETALEQLVVFIAAGMRAAAPASTPVGGAES